MPSGSPSGASPVSGPEGSRKRETEPRKDRKPFLPVSVGSHFCRRSSRTPEAISAPDPRRALSTLPARRARPDPDRKRQQEPPRRSGKARKTRKIPPRVRKKGPSLPIIAAASGEIPTPETIKRNEMARNARFLPIFRGFRPLRRKRQLKRSADHPGEDPRTRSPCRGGASPTRSHPTGAGNRQQEPRKPEAVI